MKTIALRLPFVPAALAAAVAADPGPSVFLMGTRLGRVRLFAAARRRTPVPQISTLPYFA